MLNNPANSKPSGVNIGCVASAATQPKLQEKQTRPYTCRRIAAAFIIDQKTKIHPSFREYSDLSIQASIHSVYSVSIHQHTHPLHNSFYRPWHDGLPPAVAQDLTSHSCGQHRSETLSFVPVHAQSLLSIPTSVLSTASMSQSLGRRRGGRDPVTIETSAAASLLTCSCMSWNRELLSIYWPGRWEEPPRTRA